ncbi:helix-turn-helix domain-containing protein [Chitinophaga rhizophila]|uniref:Helix-turn-helix domain-containing protein n=1 Tax=Chitinophaga rhizophila TaxID=2866212 RepID=A0ABS7GID4_9BACT|nr:helix-turn-helix transcriptional regulator [Chitinophaga rhizophila]MBW8687444.1 helix-turn-helix domain-containing protein [Chitinophaga rhizophila]
MSEIFEDAMQAVPPHAQERATISFDIIDRIEAVLEMKGMSQNELAAALGMPASEISKWMRGTYNFDVETIAKINIALGIKVLEIPRGRYRRQMNGLLHHLYATVVPLGSITPVKDTEVNGLRALFHRMKSGQMLSLPLILKKN